MCILLLHYHPSSSSRSPGINKCSCPYHLIVANNRDEFFERATAPLSFWEDNPDILAGRDLHKAGEKGTWLGVSRKGRLSVLTNYRTHPDNIKPNAKSRGCIVSDYLSVTTPPQEYCQSLLSHGGDYNGFSFIAADFSTGRSDLVYCSNYDEGRVRKVTSVVIGEVSKLAAGNYGLSNELLDTPWRKVKRGKERLVKVLEEMEPATDKGHLTDKLFEILNDDTCLHPDPSIPDTNFSEEVLNSTSSIFVRPVTIYGHQYGTRTNSVVLVDRNGEVTFTERTMAFPLLPGNSEWTTNHYTFSIC